METQDELTYLQKTVILKELERQQEEAKSGQNNLPQSKNSLHQRKTGPNAMSGETITYINDNA